MERIIPGIYLVVALLLAVDAGLAAYLLADGRTVLALFVLLGAAGFGLSAWTAWSAWTRWGGRDAR